MYYDSFDKLAGYMAGVARAPFQYKGHTMEPPREIYVSWKIFRELTCPPGCAACCPKFTLDYFPESDRLRRLSERYPGPARAARMPLFGRKVTVNGVERELLTYDQTDNPTAWCANLLKGWCSIHEANPFTCEFETFKILRIGTKAMVTNKKFGRGWAMRRIDGGKGALCVLQPSVEGPWTKLSRLLEELNWMCGLFEIETHTIAMSRIVASMADEARGAMGDLERLESKRPVLVNT